MRMRPKSARPGAKKPGRPAKSDKMKPAVMPKKRGDQKPSLKKPAPKKGGRKMKPAVMPKRQKR